ncbi:MAG: sodium:proton antiporter [Gammaproteobacteria bacterium]|nr:MAG: sodium:proton antiporter [Gammaproteobacteria bacterium]RLA11741.1 MAG: sodium:proton antiporter [Gammaproteobacteria bacterium]RLA17880.1 MAG: sodium:proton antiporter [Gammaproteobacteria bacterium]
MINFLSWVLLLSGCFCVLISAIGLIRMPDLFTRMHAAGVGDTLGAILVIAGLMLQAGPTLLLAKLVLIMFFLLFTGPTACHALAKAALAGGEKPLLDDNNQ